MDFKEKISVVALAAKYQCALIGSSENLAIGINEIHRVREGDITFVDVAKYYSKALNSNASIILIDKETECPDGKTLLVHNNPFELYEQIVNDHFKHSPILKSQSEHNFDPSTIIEPNTVIAPNVKIGKQCYIQSHVYIAQDTIIGDHVTIQANCSIGTDAFYFKKEGSTYQKWTSAGNVVIENQVDIGPGCTINRGVSSPTIIGEGSKLDSQVHIGHGAIIGKNCLLAAQVGIAGKSIIEDGVVLYGQVGVAQNIRIGKEAVILAKSGVSKNLEGGKVYFGYPAVEAKDKYRELATLRQIVKNSKRK